MPTGHTTPLPLSTWDRDTLRAVAIAYRRSRRLGERDLPVRHADEAAFAQRPPTVPEREAQETVALMISAVARGPSDMAVEGRERRHPLSPHGQRGSPSGRF
jgi:hypothetical protein